MRLLEADIHEGFLNFAARYISQRKNINPAITELRRNPDTFTRIAWQFDQVIDDFECRVKSKFPPHDYEVTLMPNVFRARELLKDKEIPGLVSLYRDNALHHLKTGVWVFQEANRLMEKGERDSRSDGWLFHQDLDDTEDLTSVLLLEMYGLYSRRINPELTANGINPVVALEEVLGYGHIHSDLFIAARRWYTEDKGFSPRMIRHINSIDVTKLKRSRPPIENPEYKIFEVKDPNAILSEETRAVLLGAHNPDQLMTEVGLQRLLCAFKARAEKVYLVHWEGSEVPRGIVIGGQEVAWTQSGVVTAREGKKIGTYERIIKHGGRYGDEQFMAIFLMSI